MACSKCNSPTRRIMRGLRGVAQSVLGIGKAPDAMIQRRRALCAECPHAVPCPRGTTGAIGGVCWCGKLWDGVLGHSVTCGCSIPLKTRIRNEKCPLGVW